ncbi:MAG: HigA family addiction module antitoxin [Acidimicrobiaceae bacterium]|nr:HigA family addiction module antitoxin [Acidimicrobiaceae bacterium]
MTKTYTPAEVFPPGEYLRDELDERGWTVTEFAGIIDRPLQAVSEILNGKKAITAETACSFSEALGTTPELWLNLQSAYRLHRLRSAAAQDQPSPVARRARLREVIPLAEVRSRGWIPRTDDLDVTEAAVCELLEINTLDDDPEFALAARRSNSADPISIEQSAWLGHVRRVAEGQTVADFAVDALEELAQRLPRLLKDGPAGLPGLPSLFGDCGVCLVFAQGLRGGKLDGAVTFLTDARPAIGLTTRGDRFDSLLYTLLHECAHLTLGHIDSQDGTILDDDLRALRDDPAGVDDPAEIEADEQASAWLFPRGFCIKSTSVPAIVEASSRYEVHPSVVVGRVQYETQNWSRYRNLIPKVRPELQDAGLLS